MGILGNGNDRCGFRTDSNSPGRFRHLKIGEREGRIEYQGRDETQRRGAE